MKKKYLFLGLGIFLLLISGGIIYALTQTVTQGDEVTVTKSIICGSRIPADLDSSDGFVRYIYGAWALKSPSGNIIQQQGPEQLAHNEYSYEATTNFTADEIGRYSLILGIFYVEQQYNITTQMWETIDSRDCSTSPNSQYVDVNYPQPNLTEIVAIINQLFQNWVNSL